MDPEVIVPILGMGGAILAMLGGIGMVGLKIWSNHKLKMREAPEGGNERLTEAVQQLQEEITELQERADFTERVLSEVRARKVIGPSDST